MTDVADKIGQAATPRPDAGDSAPSQDKDLGRAPDGSPRTPYVAQLEAQMKRYRSRAESLENEAQELRELTRRFSEARLESPPSAQEPSSPTSLKEFSDTQLSQAIREQAEAQNWEAHEALIQERARRNTERAVREAESSAMQKFEKNSHRASVMNGIQREFFPDVTSPDDMQNSPLWQQADIEYANLIRVYGKDSAEAIPELQELSLRRARDGIERRNQQEELQKLRDERDELREQLRAIEEGRKGNRVRSPEVTEALQSQGVKGALRSLAQSLYADKMDGAR